MERIIYGDKESNICLVQMLDDHDMEFLSDEYDSIASHYKTVKPLLIAVHFQEPGLRTAKGFIWAMDAVLREEPDND